MSEQEPDPERILLLVEKELDRWQRHPEFPAHIRVRMLIDRMKAMASPDKVEEAPVS